MWPLRRGNCGRGPLDDVTNETSGPCGFKQGNISKLQFWNLYSDPRPTYATNWSCEVLSKSSHQFQNTCLCENVGASHTEDGQRQRPVNIAHPGCFLRIINDIQILFLKMLVLYRYTLIIDYKTCNMLSIQNQLTLQKKLQNFMTNNVFWTKKVKTQQKQKKSNIKTLAGVGNWTWDLSHTKRMCYLCTINTTE